MLFDRELDCIKELKRRLAQNYLPIQPLGAPRPIDPKYPAERAYTACLILDEALRSLENAELHKHDKV